MVKKKIEKPVAKAKPVAKSKVAYNAIAAATRMSIIKDYKANDITLDAIADKYQVSVSFISKLAKSEGLTRAAVKAKVKAPVKKGKK